MSGDAWEKFSDPARGVAFRYPRDLGTGYIHAVDWPPQVSVEDGPFTCLRAGTETARRTECERERAAFSIDPIIDAIAQSVTLTGS